MAVGCACVGYLLLMGAAFSAVLQHTEKKPPVMVEPSTSAEGHGGTDR